MKGNGRDEELEEFDLQEEEELYVELDDDRRAELDGMIGSRVLGIELWEESLADEEEPEPVKPEERVFFDCDLFLEDNQTLELYVASAYPDPNSDNPVQGTDNIYDVVGRLADDNLELVDYDQVDDEGGLYLAFGRGDKTELVLVASAWMVSEWEPEEDEEA